MVNCLLLSKVGWLPTFFPYSFKCCKIHLRVFKTQSGFLLVLTSFGTPSFFIFITTTFLIYVCNFAFSKFIWLHICSHSKGGSVNISIVSSFFYEAIYVQLKFHFHLYHFLFLWCTFISVGQFFLLIIHFYKMPHGLITKKQGGNATAHFAVSAWTEQEVHRDQSPWLVTGHDAHVIYTVICGLESWHQSLCLRN